MVLSQVQQRSRNAYNRPNNRNQWITPLSSNKTSKISNSSSSNLKKLNVIFLEG